MYAALFRVLPGPLWLRIILMLILIIAAVWALFTWVFPWVELQINPLEVTVEE